MPWVKLDDNLHVNPKMVGLSLEAMGLYVLALSYCAHQLTDGRVPGGWAKKHAGSRAKRLIAELVDARGPESSVGLWAAADADYLIHDYLEFNPSREQVLRERRGKSAVKSAAGRKGAEARWQKDGSGIANGKAAPMATGVANG